MVKRDYQMFILIGICMIVAFLFWNRSTFIEGFEAPPEVIAPDVKIEDIKILKDVWIINLDKSKERWNTMLEQVKVLDPLPVNRWSATDGRILKEKDYVDEKIPIIIRPEFTLASKQERRKGEIGCYLSHKKLIEFLGKKSVEDDDGHLILEDDVEIDKNTLQRWMDVSEKLDKDWDIFFFGIHDPQLKDPVDGISKVTSVQSLHAYMVRHKSIPKILEIIKIMYDPIDEIIRWNSDKLNLYAMQPFTINQRKNYPSDIRGGEVT